MNKLSKQKFKDDCVAIEEVLNQKIYFCNRFNKEKK